MNVSDECAENIKVLERGFDAFLNEYREQAEIWKTLEAKAQGAARARARRAQRPAPTITE